MFMATPLSVKILSSQSGLVDALIKHRIDAAKYTGPETLNIIVSKAHTI